MGALPTDAGDAIVTGGTGAIVLGVLYALKLGLDWYRVRSDRTPTASVQVTDAATINAIASQTLHDLQAENHRLRDRVTALEREKAELDDAMDRLEDEVRTLTLRLTRVTEELAAFRERHIEHG